MATLYSVQAAKYNLAATGFEGQNPSNEAGRTFAVGFDYLLTASETTSDFIQLCQVPAGSRIVGVYFANEDAGTSFIVDVGDASDTNRLASAAQLGTASAGYVAMVNDSDAAPVAPISLNEPATGYGYKYNAPTWIGLTPTTVTSLTANQIIRGHILCCTT